MLNQVTLFVQINFKKEVVQRRLSLISGKERKIIYSGTIHQISEY